MNNGENDKLITILSKQQKATDNETLNVVTPNIYSINSTWGNKVLAIEESDRKETFMQYLNKFK